MKECNACTKSCNPGQARLMSDNQCSTYRPPFRGFKFPEIVSRIVIAESESDVIKMLAVHTDKMFEGAR